MASKYQLFDKTSCGSTARAPITSILVYLTNEAHKEVLDYHRQEGRLELLISIETGLMSMSISGSLDSSVNINTVSKSLILHKICLINYSLRCNHAFNMIASHILPRES